jgi:formiminotetrahydrofolate cyclodeaminase
VTSLWQHTLADIRDQTASASPTPGGGSIGAVTGTFGCGLVLMALEITAKRHPSPALRDALAAGRTLLARIADAADRDVALFDAYLAALRLPKDERQTALSSAAVDATVGPLAAAEDLLAALDLAASALPLVTGSVVSDVHAGADILLGSLLATLRGVDVNLPSIGDADAVRSFAERAATIRQTAADVRAAIAARE